MFDAGLARNFITRLDESRGNLAADRHCHGGENQGYAGGDKTVFKSRGAASVTCKTANHAEHPWVPRRYFQRQR